MISYAVFAGTYQEYKNWCVTNNVKQSEAKYIKAEKDIYGLKDVTIIMIGTWNEKGFWYSDLADKLERLDMRRNPKEAISNFTDSGQPVNTETTVDDSDDEGGDLSSLTDKPPTTGLVTTKPPRRKKPGEGADDVDK